MTRSTTDRARGMVPLNSDRGAAMTVPGCIVGPELQAAAGRPSRTRSAAPTRSLAAACSSLADEPWWELFQDEQLQTLIRTALDAERRSSASRRREFSKRRRSSASPAPTSFPPSSAGVNRARPDGSAAALGLSTQNRRRHRRSRGPRPWELDFWGRFRRATEAARAQLAGHRVGPPRGRRHAGQPGRRARTSGCARSISSSTISRRTLGIAAGVAAADPGARERRRDVAARRAPGRAARLRRRRPDRHARARDRAAGELPERAPRRQSRADCARPRR